MTDAPLNIAVNGAVGRMGRRIVALTIADEELKLSAALEYAGSPRLGEDAGEFPGTDVDFAKILLDQDNISVVPGSSYGASTGRFVRISFGTESDERIKIALTAIARRTSAN